MLIPCISIFRSRWGVQHAQKNYGKDGGSKIANTHFNSLWAHIIMEWASQWSKRRYIHHLAIEIIKTKKYQNLYLLCRKEEVFCTLFGRV